MELTQAYARHLSLLVPAFDQYRQFYGQPSDLQGARQFLAERFERRDSVIFLSGTPDGSHPMVHGFVQLYPSFSSVSMKRLWILNDLFVCPDARGQGIATALLERSRQHAVETRAKGLVLATGVDNRTAQRLYERLGYTHDAEFRHYFLPV